jgi:hypothetical protein
MSARASSTRRAVPIGSDAAGRCLMSSSPQRSSTASAFSRRSRSRAPRVGNATRSPRTPAAPATPLARHQQVVLHRQPPEHLHPLERASQSKTGAPLHAPLGDVGSVQCHGPGVRTPQSADHVEQGGLACAVGPDQSAELTRRHPEGRRHSVPRCRQSGPSHRSAQAHRFDHLVTTDWSLRSPTCPPTSSVRPAPRQVTRVLMWGSATTGVHPTSQQQG